MLKENLKSLRKSKGFSQEELAIRLGVVRQTVSKWEKGLSVPDSELLLQIAELFEVSVSDILGEAVIPDNDKSYVQKIAEQLERLNAELAERNARGKKILRVVRCAAGAAAIYLLLWLLYSLFISPSGSIAIVGSTDGPTALYTSGEPHLLFILISVAIVAIAAFFTRKK